ncbi:phosphatase PAP2 family protein [Bordetella petrii]|uniref:Conserved putative membrane protein n=1 Tax=Bordetella petrii (strain ATCC BAA-461 / DSM 12804 / CCUG 43448 / CIP 107267 / Se-1111R) TaxID=340100 RepID=A9IHY9_BORPD|nr:phosphatase PAP2 family protein [Bordetella petrii]CAP42011.1 conserved putative membrane protein [Bordetella petrii]
MEASTAWVAAHPLLIFLAVPAAAGLCAWLLGRRYGRPSAAQPAWVCWGVAAGAGLVFLVLAVAMSLRAGLVDLDNALAAALSLSMPPSLLWLLSWFTYLGDRNLLTVIAVGMTAGLLWRRQWRVALACAIVTAGAGSLNQVLKHLFQRVRPEHVHGYVEADGWSFPSGHASAALAVYGFACYLVLRATPARWHPYCLAGAAALITAIGVSRVLLQVHFLSDVLAGFALSLTWLALCLAGAERVRAFRRRT